MGAGLPLMIRLSQPYNVSDDVVSECGIIVGGREWPFLNICVYR